MFIESSRSENRRIQKIWSISCSNNKNLIWGSYVHLHEQLSNNSIHNSMRISTISSFRNQSIKLVHENYARFTSNCSLKHLSHIFLTLTNIHVQKLWSFDTYETHFALFSDTFSKQSFSCAWRTIKKKSCSWFYPFVENLWMTNWQ